MNITSILTTAAVNIAVTVPNVGAMQRVDYPVAALRGDATSPLDGPRDVKRNHIIPPEHGGTGARLAEEVIADQRVGSLGRGEQGRHVRGGSSSAPLGGSSMTTAGNTSRVVWCAWPIMFLMRRGETSITLKRFTDYLETKK